MGSRRWRLFGVVESGMITFERLGVDEGVYNGGGVVQATVSTGTRAFVLGEVGQSRMLMMVLSDIAGVDSDVTRLSDMESRFVGGA